MSHSGTYTVTVTDNKGCQTTVNPSVELTNPFESLTLDPMSVPAVCNGMPFDAVHPSLPNGTHYSWSAPTGNGNLSGMSDGENQTSVHGTLTNISNIPQSITYTVTPTIGTLCAGDAFNVTVGVDVTVNPTVLAALENKTTCKNADVELSLALSNVYSKHNVVWYLGNTEIAREENVAAPNGGFETLTTTMFSNNMEAANCLDTLHYTIAYSDESGCTVSQGADIFVQTPEWHVTAENGAATVTNISAAVAPHSIIGFTMPTVTDGCGMTCTTNNNPEVTTTGSNCDGTVTYTYTYTACDGTTDTWSYVYTIQGSIVVNIDSVDAGCYTTTNDGFFKYTVTGVNLFTVELDGVEDEEFVGRANRHYTVENLTDGVHTLRVRDANSTSDCFVQVEVEITPDPTMLTVTAASGEWTYDATAHDTLAYKVQFGNTVVSENVASGTSVTLPNGDVLTATVVGDITNVGTADNTVSNITVMRGTSNVTCHYNTTLATGALTINPAAVVVTANAATKVYGATDPDYSATVTGLLAGQSESLLTYTFSRQNGEDVGTYTITPAGEAVQGNYAVTYATGLLTITPATATVTADAKTKVYGNLDPTLTATVSGLQYDDATSVITYSLSRAEGENVGKYAITPVGEATQGNYNVVYKQDTLTITPLNVNVAITGNTAMVAANGSQQQVTGFTAISDNSSYDVALFEGVGFGFTVFLTTTQL